MALNKNLRKKGILFFIAENDDAINNELEQYGAGDLIKTGVIRKDIETIFDLLKLKEPYTLVEK